MTKPINLSFSVKTNKPISASTTPVMSTPSSPPPYPTTLPIINISPFLIPSSTAQARHTTAQAINSACLNYGFFYLTGHGIPQSTLDRVLSLARTFFSLPLEQKKKIQRYDAGGPEGGDGARGYQGMGENVTMGRRDLHEAVDWYREWDGESEGKGGGRGKGVGRGGVEVLQGKNLWPEEPAELREVYLAYIEDVKRVGTAVVRAMGQALELGPRDESTKGGESRKGEDDEVFARATEDSFWVMRMIGYPKLPSAVDAATTGDKEDLDSLSCGQHTDYGCLTLLLADPTPGALQVQYTDPSTNETTWINADPIPGAFVVNIGDMMERWTNGLWKSTVHRVIHRGEGFRVSVPFFFEPGFDVVVRPLGKCVKENGGRAKFGEKRYGEHLFEKVGGNFYAGGGEDG